MRGGVGAHLAAALAAFVFTVLGDGVASAQTTPPVYPEADTDRPLVLFPGMTVLDLSTDVATFFRTNPGVTTTTRFIQPEQDLTVEHAFGPVELLAELVTNPFGPVANVQASTMVGPGAV